MMTAYIYEPTTPCFGSQDAPDFLYWLDYSLDAGAKILLVDLHQVDAIDSSGVGTLLIAHNRSRRKAAQLIICSIQADVLAQFEQAEAVDQFEIFANREEAVRFINAQE